MNSPVSIGGIQYTIMNPKEENKVLKQATKQMKKEIKAVKKMRPLKKPSHALKVEKPNGPIQGNQSRYFRRIFSKRDAAKLAWMRCVADPFTSTSVPIPPILAPGVTSSCPRMYPITLKGFAAANSNGRVYVGLNADSWMPDPTAAVGTPPKPYLQYIGNSTANSGARGYPLHYTNSSYAGCPTITGSTGVSYPGPAISTASAVNGLIFVQLPNTLIDVQLPGDPASGNAFQRYSCVSAGLRVRPSAPASGSLVMSGTVMGVQQILGDTVVTCPSAASGTNVVGGVDAYAYIGGMGVTQPSSGFSKDGLTQEMVGREEWDIPEWPKKDGIHTWFSVSAIPNQSCCYGMWTPPATGNTTVGYPQLSFIGAGLISGQTVEFEAKLIYAYYGGVSYQENQTKLLPSVPEADLMSLGTAASPHMNISNGSGQSGGRVAAKAVAQTAIDEGGIHPRAAADFIKSGAKVVEDVTGSSLGDLIGEGLGFLASAFL